MKKDNKEEKAGECCKSETHSFPHTQEEPDCEKHGGCCNDSSNNCGCTDECCIDYDDKKDERIQELTNDLKRLQAEFENFRKRTEKENQEHLKYMNAGFAKKLLPTLDALDSAVKHIPEMKQVREQLLSTLQKEGLIPISSLNEKLDPYKHEVLMQEEMNPEKEDRVVEEFQKGYLFRDVVIRAAKVKIGVARKVKNNNQDKGEKNE